MARQIRCAARKAAIPKRITLICRLDRQHDRATGALMNENAKIRTSGSGFPLITDRSFNNTISPKMNTTRLAILILALNSLPLLAEEKLPLKVDAGAAWKVEYKGDSIQIFTLTRPTGENVVLMFSRWPAPGGKEQIPATIKKMAEAFLAEVAKNEELKDVKEEYKIEKLEGIEYSGEAAVFATDDGMRQTMFMISNGDGIWNGQFTGSSQMWDEAKEILKKLRKG